MHERIEHHCKRIEAVGSRVTCTPPPTDTDQDFLVLAKDGESFYAIMQELDADYYMKGGSDIMNAEDEMASFGEWGSYKKVVDGVEVNYIVCESQWFFDGFMLATEVAKQCNLLRKQDRVDLFQCVMYDNYPDWVDYSTFPDTTMPDIEFYKWYARLLMEREERDDIR